MDPFLLLVFIFLHALLLLLVSSESTNGSIGESVLWPCKHRLTEEFVPEKTYIYWQGTDSSNDSVVAHAYVKGTEDFLHQSKPFKNRTEIFLNQLDEGNFSLIIKNLTLGHDRTSLEVFLMQGDSTKSLCQKTLYVAAPFQKPNIELNQTSATCSTKGGYPKPEVTWVSTDSQGQETTLEPQEVRAISNTENGTFNLFSTANISGLKRITCRIFNPTSGETQEAPEDVTPAETSSTGLIIGIVVAIIVLIASIILCVICKYYSQICQFLRDAVVCRSGNENRHNDGPPDGNEDENEVPLQNLGERGGATTDKPN